MADPVTAASNAVSGAASQATSVLGKAFRLALKAGTVYGALTAVAVLTGGSSALAAAAVTMPTTAAAGTSLAATQAAHFGATAMLQVPMEGAIEGANGISEGVQWLAGKLPTPH